MRLIQKSRGGGKTTMMLAWLRTHPTGVLVTFSEGEAHRLRQMCKWADKDFDKGRIMVADRGCLRGREVGPVAVDNLDLVLESLLGAPVYVATATKAEGREIDQPRDDKGRFKVEDGYSRRDVAILGGDPSL